MRPLTAARGDRSRLRLVVVQALVFSLFATLFVRLYYLQVIGGESYQAQAADQSVRDIVVQPQRGLIVDSQGRPLVANRTSWVISMDRTLLGKLEEGQRTELVRRVAVVVDAKPADVEAQLLVADLDLLGGHVEDAFTRLLDLVRSSTGPERDRARTHLLELFSVVGANDERVRKGRTALMSALF